LLDRMTRQAGLISPGEGQDPPFEGALRAAVRDLDEPARAILEALCVAGAPITHEVLARAAAVEPPALATGISRLAASNLAQTIGARSAQVFAPYHERVRIAVLASLDTHRRIEIHRRIAAALETSDRIDPGPLSTHWLGAGDLVQAGYYAEAAGDAAVERLAFDCAARFYERALSTRIATGAARSALLVKIGKARANAGWGRHAADAFQQAAEGATPAQALQLHRQAAEELLMAGDIEGGTAVLRDVLARLGMWMPSSSLAAAKRYDVQSATTLWPVRRRSGIMNHGRARERLLADPERPVRRPRPRSPRGRRGVGASRDGPRRRADHR
jgi:eukaryotic-like serine/threonine-protein kinase